MKKTLTTELEKAWGGRIRLPESPQLHRGGSDYQKGILKTPYEFNPEPSPRKMTQGTHFLCSGRTALCPITPRILRGAVEAPTGGGIGKKKIIKKIRNPPFSPIVPVEVNLRGILGKPSPAATPHASGDNPAVCTSNHSLLFLQVILPSASKQSHIQTRKDKASTVLASPQK